MNKEEIERLTKRLEEAQLGYLAVEEKNKRLNNIINEALESITYYDNDTKRKEPIFEEFRAVMKILMESDKE